MIEIDSRIINGVISSEIRCINAEVFYRNSIPYLKYKGEAFLLDGRNIIVEFPMLDLTINKIESNLDDNKKFIPGDCSIIVEAFKHISVCIGLETSGKIYLKEKEMTKEDIEKELGYPIKIVE